MHLDVFRPYRILGGKVNKTTVSIIYCNGSRAILRSSGVYFISDGLGRLKIGSSIDIPTQFKQIKRDYSNLDLMLLRVIYHEVYWGLETWLHVKFHEFKLPRAHKKGTREWYLFNEEMMVINTPPKAFFGGAIEYNKTLIW